MKRTAVFAISLWLFTPILAHAQSSNRTVVVISLDGFPALCVEGSASARSHIATVDGGGGLRGFDEANQSDGYLATPYRNGHRGECHSASDFVQWFI